MSYFVVTFLGLIAITLIVTPLVWTLSREKGELGKCVYSLQTDMADVIRQAEYYRLACEHASDGMIVQDKDGLIVWCNPAYLQLHRTTADRIMGRNPLSFALPSGMTQHATNIEETPFDLEEGKLQLCLNENAEGELFWNQISIAFRRSSDGREHSIAICRDVTEQVEQEKAHKEISLRLEHEATHDGLTSVPNRAAFLAFMDDLMQGSQPRSVGLLHIDLDNFKIVNDTHGHPAGDAVLMHCATALRRTIREADLVARVGGDEFVVVCPDTTSLEALDALSLDLLDVLSLPFEWSNRMLNTKASIGAAFSDQGDLTADELLVQADFALYEAKRAGRNRVALYDEDLHRRHTTELRHAVELTEAIDTGALDYHFQPTMDLAAQKVTGMETLVRWNHPIDGLIPPDQFLPMVKDLGLMGALDLLSMTAALKEKARLNAVGLGHLGIAFNASPELLAHPDFIERLIWGVEAGGIDRAQVTIEVLENTNFGDATETASHAAVIKDLRDAGFQVHLDDFGIGFAGLSHLASLAVTGVKIDRGLISELLHDPISRKIVRKIVELSNDLGLTVIGEGVEDLHTANTLRAMGCGVIQGYWLSRPLPQDQLHDWLEDHVEGPVPLQA